MTAERDLTPLVGTNRKGEVVGFARGLDTVSPETAMPGGSLREATNIDLDRLGRPRTRPGYVLRYSGTAIHSLWSDGIRTLFVEGGSLKRLLPDWSARTLTTGLSPGAAVSYASVDGVIYWSNGAQAGRVLADDTASAWGVPGPAGQPLLAALATGGLDAGIYQVAVTFAGSDGEEGGTGLAASVTVSSGGGIRLTAIPQGQASLIRVYASPPNGDGLLHHVDVPMGTTSLTLTKTLRGAALETQFSAPIAPGQIVRYFAGRMWVADGAFLKFSLPLRYGLYRPAQDFFLFPSAITVLEPVADGLFVVADQTYFLAGVVPAQMVRRRLSGDTGVVGTGAQVEARHFGVEGGDHVAYWLGSRGAVVGTAGGGIRHLTDGRINLPAYASGASLFRERQGVRQVITTTRTPGPGSGFGAADSAVAEVVKNKDAIGRSRSACSFGDAVVAEALRGGSPI